MKFSDRLKGLREKNDMTQEQLAKVSGVSPRTIQRYECGTSRRTVLLWGVLFVFLFRQPIGIHNSLHHNIHIILCQLAAGKQTSYFICELLRLFGTSCAVLLRSLSNEHTIRTQKLIHGNIKGLSPVYGTHCVLEWKQEQTEKG